MASPARRRSLGLVGRLLVSTGLVVLAAGATAWLVAVLVGPALFHDHMVRAGAADPETFRHAEEAFRSAGGVTSAVAAVAAATAALVVGGLLSRRIGRSLAALAQAAAEVGAGGYGARVPSPGTRDEFAAVAAAFNSMAARLEDGERLRRRLLADVAHEVRTPVATITAYLEAVEDGVAPLDAGTTAVLREQAERLTRLAQDLAAVTRAESGELDLHPEELAPALLVEAAVRAGAERAAAAGVALTSRVAPGAPAVLADGVRMAQVLDNLVGNALRHTPAGGTVVVAARTPAAGAPGERDGATVELRVTDSGEGIPAEHLPHVFERFYRVGTARDRASGGSGIGLAISRALVEAQGGTITAASGGPGEGSTFAVRLPAAPGGTTSGAPGAS